jgi:hypothetical protein
MTQAASTDSDQPETGICQGCGKDCAADPHICPYQHEINDSEALCNCCQSCSYECAMDI